MQTITSANTMINAAPPIPIVNAIVTANIARISVNNINNIMYSSPFFHNIGCCIREKERALVQDPIL